MPILNPYAPPRYGKGSPEDPSQPLPLLPESRWPEVDVRAAALERSLLTRRFRLFGDLEGEMLYDARGWGERVYVSGSKIASSSVWHWQMVAPHIDFRLAWHDYAIPASLDVKATILFIPHLRHLRLTIAGRVVYEE